LEHFDFFAQRIAMGLQNKTKQTNKTKNFGEPVRGRKIWQELTRFFHSDFSRTASCKLSQG
jgi:hypothetical protein